MISRTISAVLMALVVLASVAPAVAQDRWTNTGSNWGDPGSWTAGVPGSGTPVEFSPLTNPSLTPVNPVLDTSRGIGSLYLDPNAQYGGWTIGSVGTPSLTVPSNSYVTQVRGPAAYAFNGPSLSGSGNLDIGTGATLTMGSTSTVSISYGILRGDATLVLDNSATNIANRINTNGYMFMLGGTLQVTGNIGGTTASSPAASLPANSGADTIRIVQPNGASARTVLILNNIYSDYPDSTINFVSSGAGTLGGTGGTDPRILTNSARLYSGGVLYFQSSSTPGSVLYNGTDFASYDNTRGIIPVSSITVGGGSLPAGQNITLTNSANSPNVGISSLKIAPSAAGQSLANFGGLSSPGVLLTGNTDYAITGTAYLYTSNVFVTSPQTTLSISSPLRGYTYNAINFSGGGNIALTGTSNQFPYTGSLLSINLLGGTTLRATLGVNFDTSNAQVVQFRGGVLEAVGNNSFVRYLGTSNGQVNWTNGNTASVGSGNWNYDAGGGGFSAYNGTLVVQISGGAPLTWGSTSYFIQDGYALTFGSTKSNGTVNWINPLALDTGSPSIYQIREIKVVQGSGNKALISGSISGSPLTTLAKTGDGTLEFNSSTSNSYQGSTAVLGGTLAIFGDYNLGAVPASPTAGSLVLSGGTLRTWATFTLNANRGITLGPNHGTISTAGTLSYAGVVAGPGNLTLTGLLTLSGANVYSGATTIAGGTLLVNGSHTGGDDYSIPNTITGNSTLGGTGAVTLATGKSFNFTGAGSSVRAIVSPGDPATNNGIGTLSLGATGGTTVTFGANSTLAIGVSSTAADQLAANGVVTITSGAKISLTQVSTPTLGKYILLTSTSGTLGNTFDTTGTTVPSGYRLVYSANELDLQHQAALGTITAAPADSTIIIGGSTPVTFSVTNSAPSGSATLNFSASPVVSMSGSASGSAAPGSSSGSIGGMTFHGAALGLQSGKLNVSDPDATGSPKTATVDVTVRDHANASFANSGSGAPTTNATLDFGNVLKGSASGSQSFTIYNVAHNTTVADTVNLKMTAGGFSISGDANFSTNLAAFTALAANDGVGQTYQAFFNTNVYSTTGSATVTFSGLVDDSTLNGAGTNNNGVLSLLLNGRVGLAIPAATTNANLHSFNPAEALTASVGPGNSYAGLSSKITRDAVLDNITGFLTSGSQLGTEAVLRDGTNSIGGTENVTMNWRTRAPCETGNSLTNTATSPPVVGAFGSNPGRFGLFSDIVEITGMNGAAGGTTHTQTDKFVLEMSYNPADLQATMNATGKTETQLAADGLLYLGWLDTQGTETTADDVWRNAVEGNFTGIAYNGSGLLDSYDHYKSDDFHVGHVPGKGAGNLTVGDWGIDLAAHTVWAVLDHNSQFAVLPEPSTFVLGACGVAGLIAVVRRRRK